MYDALLTELQKVFPCIAQDKALEILSRYDVKLKPVYGGNPDLDSKIEQYLAAKRFEGLSERTLTSYKGQLGVFARYMCKAVVDITEMDIKMYLGESKENKLSTICTKLTILRSFFKWLHEEDIIQKNPTVKININNKEKRLPKALKRDEVLIMRENCKTLRERAIIETLYATGCRLSELTQMGRNIDFSGKGIRIIGKGNKERPVYLNESATYFLKKYLFSRLDDCDALFVTERQPYRRMGNRAVQREVERIAERAGIEKRVHPHIFRHTFATHLLENGASLMLVQELLGHTNPSTTQRYATMNESMKKEQYQKYMAQ
jgi:integrase/recombinase XerD